MRKVSIRLCIDLDDDTQGFAIVPTNNGRILKNNEYVVTTPGLAGGKTDAWGCKNSVTLKERIFLDQGAVGDGDGKQEDGEQDKS